MDGTHIRIKRPSREQEPDFLNRKGYHSVLEFIVIHLNNFQ